MKKLLTLALLLTAALPAHAQFSRITGITGTQNTGTQNFYASSPFTIKAGANCAWTTVGTSTVHTFDCPGAGGGFIGGAVTANHLVSANGANTETDIAGTSVVANLLTWTSQAAGTTPFTFTAHATQSVPLLDFNHTSAGTCNGLVCIRGDGIGSNLTLLDVVQDDQNSYAMTLGNVDATQRWGFYVNDVMGGAEDGWLVFSPLNTGGGLSVVGGTESTTFYSGSGGYRSNSSTDPADTGVVRLANAEVGLCAEHNPTGTDDCITLNTSNVWTLGSLTASAALNAASYATATNCSDSAGAAACGSAAAGSVVVDAGATTVVVSTTAVTANSQIFPVFDSSLGTRLGVTCNTTVALPIITARTAATSFTITVPVAPAVNPACYSYFIVN